MNLLRTEHLETIYTLRIPRSELLMLEKALYTLHLRLLPDKSVSMADTEQYEALRQQLRGVTNGEY